MTQNKLGLGRYIPSEIRRRIRQKCGFGCIVCGDAFYQYDHLDIEFKDAETHEADKIVLLCGSCHDRKNKGVLSKDSLLRHAKNPAAKRIGFAKGILDFGEEHPTVVLGTLTCNNVDTILEIDGISIFSITKSDNDFIPFLINARLFNNEGREILRIEENAFIVENNNWDITTEGKEITIRADLGVFDLKLRVEPPKKIIIERLNMIHKGFSIIAREGQDTIIQGSNNNILQVNSADISDAEAAIIINNNSLILGRRGSVHIHRMIVNPHHLSPRKLDPISIPRNKPCICGSNIRFKYCCGKI